MVCPFCITSALVANSPLIIGTLGTGLAIKKRKLIRDKIVRRKNLILLPPKIKKKDDDDDDD